MKLRFLGQTYSSSNCQLETIPSDLTACFRGQKYALRRPVQTFSPQFNVRIYRGIVYCKN